MAISQSDLDALDKAIASGASEVEFGGRRVKYQHTGEMIAARDHIATVLARQATPQRKTTYRFTFTTSRGD